MTAINYFFLGLAYKNSYQKREALEIFEKCRSILEKHPNLDSDMLRLVFFQLGDIYLNSVEYAKALDFYNKGLDIKEKSYFFYELCEIVEAYIKIGTSLKNMNQKGTFAPYLKKGIILLEQTIVSTNFEKALCYYYLGCLYNTANEYQKAFENYEKSTAIIKSVKPFNNYLLENIYEKLGYLCIKTNGEKALKYFKKCKKIKEKLPGQADKELAQIYYILYKIYHKNKNIKKAHKLLKKCQKQSEKVFAPNDIFLKKIYTKIALMNIQMLNIKEAIGFLDKCKTIIEKNYSNLNLERVHNFFTLL